MEYLATELPVYTDLPAAERQRLVASLQKETLAIRKEFSELVAAVLEEIRSRGNLDYIKIYYDFRNRRDFTETKSLEDVF